ncbi:mediator of RNA polymerase II transcription subunit 27-B-like [Centruroides sculpturatus]|uniref:mediator of RNA polymerase II transcription subunit 27-B-like n=1 Tax=Centruroides sculpturatus TaxID=218467 RepID=UPI000C6CCE09|nr:mediator of RNA polymerase II transcription subunit 27-B-like [Centruroides sculpturatus]
MAFWQSKMAEVPNMEALNSGLKAVKALRNTTREVFKLLADGMKACQGDEGKEKQFLSQLQTSLANVISRLRDLETACTLLGNPTTPLTLGNSGLLSQDPTYDKSPLYTDMIKVYRWCDKVRNSGPCTLFQEDRYNLHYQLVWAKMSMEPVSKGRFLR